MKPQLEVIIQSEKNSYMTCSCAKEKFDTPFHYHPEYELTYIVSSKGFRYIGNRIDGFEENDLVLLGPNIPHCWKNFQHATDLSAAMVFHWRNDLLGYNWREKKEFNSINCMLTKATHGLQFTSKTAKNVKSKMQLALKGAPFENLLVFLEVLHELAHGKSTQLVSSSGFANQLNAIHLERLNIINNFIEKNYKNKIMLSEVADLVHLSPESFCRYFSKVTNHTFVDYLNRPTVRTHFLFVLSQIPSLINISKAVYSFL